MKKRLFYVAALFMLLTSFKSGHEGGVNFIDNDWQAAKQASIAQHKPIFAFVYGETCMLSSKMNDEVFNQPEVIKELNDKFICIMFDANATMNMIKMEQWGVYGTPTFVFLDKNRDVATKASGFKDTKVFLKIAEEGLAKY